MRFRNFVLFASTVTLIVISNSERAAAQNVPSTVSPQRAAYPDIHKLNLGSLMPTTGGCPTGTAQIEVLSQKGTWDQICVKTADPTTVTGNGGTSKKCPLNYALNQDESKCQESPAATIKSITSGNTQFCDSDHMPDPNDISHCDPVSEMKAVHLRDDKPFCKAGYNLSPEAEEKCLLVPRWWLPLLGKDEAKITDFYGQGGSALGDSIAPLNQVSYLYGSDSRSLSADLITAYFSNGIAAALGSSVTAGASSTTATGTQVESQAQALAQLKTGGDFYVKVMYPLMSHSSRNSKQWLFVVPRLGFNFDGFGSQQTITEATEYNLYSVAEYYYQYGSNRNKNSNLQVAAFYLDLQGGGEFVSDKLATAVALKGKATWVGQIGGGIKFFGLLDVGLQKTFQQFSDPAPESSKHWHLVISLLPSGKNK